MQAPVSIPSLWPLDVMKCVEMYPEEQGSEQPLHGVWSYDWLCCNGQRHAVIVWILFCDRRDVNSVHHAGGTDRGQVAAEGCDSVIAAARGDGRADAVGRPLAHAALWGPPPGRRLAAQRWPGRCVTSLSSATALWSSPLLLARPYPRPW